MAEDRESLLGNDREPPMASFSMRSSGAGMVLLTKIRKNVLLLTISFMIASCLTVYLYLNMVAIDGTQTDHARYKPLSRRKPMLDHESIFSDSGSSMIKVSDVLAHSLVALHIAGQRVVELSLKNNAKLKDVDSKGKTLEGVDDVVTGADIESHNIIVNTIKDSYRRLNVVSEEDTTTAFENLKAEVDLLPIDRLEFAKRLRSSVDEIEGEHFLQSELIPLHETLVWIDPLDATKEYSENLTQYVTLMACIVHKSKPIAGVIHKPFTNQTYWSIRDLKNGGHRHSSHLKDIIQKNRRVKDESDGQKETIKVVVSRSHAGDVGHLIEKLYGDRAEIVSAGGSGFKTIELIAGKVDAYMHLTHIKKWDICAPQAIIDSIQGGVMTDMSGEPIEFGNVKDKVVTKGVIATLNKSIHQNLVKQAGHFKDHQ